MKPQTNKQIERAISAWIDATGIHCAKEELVEELDPIYTFDRHHFSTQDILDWFGFDTDEKVIEAMKSDMRWSIAMDTQEWGRSEFVDFWLD